jgi:hypothetical protein
VCFFQGRRLSDESTVGESNIQEGGTIKVSLKILDTFILFLRFEGIKYGFKVLQTAKIDSLDTKFKVKYEIFLYV